MHDAGTPSMPEEAKLKGRVVVLDTDPGVRWALEKGLARSGYDVLAAASAGEALREVHEHEVAAVVMEFLPEAGLTSETLAELLGAPCGPKVVCVSVATGPHHVIECIRQGASDFIPKPFGLAEVRTALARALAGEREQRVLRRPDRAGPEETAESLLVGISAAMQELRHTIQQVARTDLNCLIRGESGTGKDMVAREIHRLSPRHEKPFVKVNCTALPEQLLESELFGYEKGAFTGAVGSKPGRFELANHGVIFLDEIGDLQPSLQAKLLQVIEHKEFTKLGGRKAISVDVQIIAATNADLDARTKEGAFRDDLYFRLNEVCIWVPSIAHRTEDIPLLVRHFINKHGRFAGDSGFEITGEDLTSLSQHPWPGNVRELESTIKRWLALGQKVLPGAAGANPGFVQSPSAQPGGPPAEPMPVPKAHAEEGVAPAAPAPPAEKARPQSAAKDGAAAEEAMTEEEERAQLLRVLEECQWNRRQAAKELGMSYQTLRRRIKKFGFDQA